MRKKRIIKIARWVLDVAEELPDTRFSATDKAITFSTEVAFGFMRGNSRSIEINLFLPLAEGLHRHWKESRHTQVKKLATRRLFFKDDLNDELRRLIETAHMLSARPRGGDISTKEGFLRVLHSLCKK